MASASPPSSRSEFQIAIVCALPLEADAVDLLFDGRFDDQRYGRARGDNNTYYAGRMAGHAVVLLQLPNMGPLSAASGSAGLRSSYPNVQLALLVGVCGGLPVINDQSVYLGDVVVSKRVVNYDFGRQYPDRFVPKDGVDDSLGHNLAILQKRAQEEYGSNKYSPLPDWDDRIFPSDYQHRHCSGECGTCDQGHFCQAAANSSCTEIGCDQGQQHSRAERRRERPSGLCPRVFIGSIASGNAVIKSGKHRDRIAEEHGVIAFEMEGAGAWDEIPCIVVKGICDYADSHKSKLWQNFAAATAASVAAAIIDRYEPSDMVATGISASGMSGPASRHADNSIYGGTNGIHPQNHGIAVNGSVSHGNVVSGTLVSGDYNAGTIVHGNYHGGSNVTDASRSDGPHWLVPRAVNPLFTGRSAITETIEGAIEQEISGCHMPTFAEASAHCLGIPGSTRRNSNAFSTSPLVKHNPAIALYMRPLKHRRTFLKSQTTLKRRRLWNCWLHFRYCTSETSPWMCFKTHGGEAKWPRPSRQPTSP
ncbi:hypothetical protein MCOR03_010734 [Pyricularia oryzae]|nr:hypothetical protein MCOR03_010734 [Pyricularia oryzae]